MNIHKWQLKQGLQGIKPPLVLIHSEVPMSPGSARNMSPRGSHDPWNISKELVKSPMFPGVRHAQVVPAGAWDWLQGKQTHGLHVLPRGRRFETAPWRRNRKKWWNHGVSPSKRIIFMGYHGGIMEVSSGYHEDIYIYIWLYIYDYIYMITYIYVWLYIYMYDYIYMNDYIYIWLYIYDYIYMIRYIYI